jgi:hypothetical protein
MKPNEKLAMHLEGPQSHLKSPALTHQFAFLTSLVRVQPALASRGWVGVAAYFWAFDSMLLPPQPISCHPKT